MAIDRDKYRRMFIEEARKGLRSLNNDLVSLEKLLERPSSDATTARARVVMDAAFRTAHSLKGMGAAMGYVGFAELAHRLEDLADLARQGKAIGAEGFDLLLEGSDKLEEIVERVAEGHDEGSKLDVGDLPHRVQLFVQAVRALHSAAVSAASAAPPPPAAVTSSSAAAPRPGPAAGGAGRLVVRVKIADDASLPQV